MFACILGKRIRPLVVAVLSVVAIGAGLAPASATAAGLPDLMLGVGAPASVAQGSTFSVKVKLHNDGPVAASKPSVMGTLHRSFQITSVAANDPSFKCDFKNDDFVFGEIWACASNAPLASQGTVVATIVARAPAVAGSHSLQTMADPNNLVAESDEGNNQVNRTIQVN